MSVWESIDELLDDKEITSSANVNTNENAYYKQSLFNDDDDDQNELDQNELLGIIDENENLDGDEDDFGLSARPAAATATGAAEPGSSLASPAPQQATVDNEQKQIDDREPEHEKAFRSDRVLQPDIKMNSPLKRDEPETIHENDQLIGEAETTPQQPILESYVSFDNDSSLIISNTTFTEDASIDSAKKNHDQNEMPNQDKQQLPGETRAKPDREFSHDEDDEDDEDEEDEDEESSKEARSNHWSERRDESSSKTLLHSNHAQQPIDQNRPQTRKLPFNKNNQNNNNNYPANRKNNQFNNNNNNNNKLNKPPMQRQFNQPVNRSNGNGNGLLPLPFQPPPSQAPAPQLPSVMSIPTQPTFVNFKNQQQQLHAPNQFNPLMSNFGTNHQFMPQFNQNPFNPAMSFNPMQTRMQVPTGYQPPQQTFMVQQQQQQQKQQQQQLSPPQSNQLMYVNNQPNNVGHPMGEANLAFGPPANHGVQTHQSQSQFSHPHQHQHQQPQPLMNRINSNNYGQQSQPSALTSMPLLSQPPQQAPPVVLPKPNYHHSITQGISPCDLVLPPQAPMVPMQQAPLAPPPPIKPTTVYINPSFIAKQQQPVTEISPEKQLQQQHQQLVQPPMKPVRSRKDLDLLLEKRLAAELEAQKKEAKEQKVDKESKDGKSDSRTSTSSSSKSSSSTSQTAKKRKSTPSRSETATPAPPTKKKSTSNLESVVVVSSSSSVKSPPVETNKPAASTGGNFSAIIDDDPDYQRKLEEQKRKREEILRAKEAKRNQRILELKKAETTSVNESTDPVISSSSSSSSSHRIVKRSTSPVKLASTVTAIQNMGNTRKLVIQNLSLNTNEKELLKMCSTINVKDKIVKIETNKNEASIVFNDRESADRFFKKFNRTLVDLSMITMKIL